MLLAIPLLFLGSIAAEPPEEEPAATPESKALDKLQEAINALDDKAAQQAYEELSKNFAGKEVADEAAWRQGCFHYRRGRLDKAQDMLLALKRSGRQNRWVSLSVLGLSEVAQKRGDERAMLGYLEEAIKTPPAATARNIMDTLDTRQEATIRMARHYRDKGDFKKALDYFTRWEPKSWCGTCLMQMRADRDRQIALCRLQLGDHASVIGDSLRLLCKDHWCRGFDAWVVCRLYADAGQLNDLRSMVDTYEKARKPLPADEEQPRSPTQDLRDLLRVQALADNKDVAALVDICQKEEERRAEAFKDGERDLLRCAAAEALAGLGGTAVESLKSALGQNPAEKAWLIYALGRSTAPAALMVLKEAAEKYRGDDSTVAQNLAYALALQGEPGKKILKQLSKGESEMGKAAQEWLDWNAQPALPTTWPRPKAGSLPKQLPEVR